jgi:glyoxylase-like metal-dependent hydrolase (beta-lactamase superfamily II)
VGTGELAVVDPGSPWQEEIDRLLGFLDELVSEGRRVRAVLLTHHHRDHVGAAGAVARRFGVPIRASGETAERIPGAVGDLEDGTPIPLDGPLPMTLRPLRTDGHAPGHLVFLEERSRGLFTGDLVANGSTILIDPPEGNLDDYLASLERVRALPLGALFPAHGLVMPEGRAEIEALLEHRRERIRQVEGLLARGGTGAVEAIVEEFYAGTPAELRPFAARSAQATLEHLERRGRAEREPRGGWRLAGERKTEGAP